MTTVDWNKHVVFSRNRRSKDGSMGAVHDQFHNDGFGASFKSKGCTVDMIPLGLYGACWDGAPIEFCRGSGGGYL
jgi:hypothetical protein